MGYTWIKMARGPDKVGNNYMVKTWSSAISPSAMSPVQDRYQTFISIINIILYRSVHIKYINEMVVIYTYLILCIYIYCTYIMYKHIIYTAVCTRFDDKVVF